MHLRLLAGAAAGAIVDAPRHFGPALGLDAAVPHVYHTDRDGTVRLSVGDRGHLDVAYER